jgi:hypothetical protein
VEVSCSSQLHPIYPKLRENLNLSALNHTAAEIAAAALFETFPGVELLGGRRTSVGFSFDFRCRLPFPSEVEILLEERMRQIVREHRTIRVLEMVPFSARELLLKEGHVSRAEETLAVDGLVEIVQIGAFHDLSPGPHLSNTSELNFFKLWPMEKLGDGLFRLPGCAFPSKEELKQFLKKLRDYPSISHERVGLKKSLWRLLEAQVAWLPAGLSLRGGVVEVIRTHLFQGAVEVSFPNPGSRKEIHAKIGPEVAEVWSELSPPWDPEVGLFAGVGGMQIQLSSYVQRGQSNEKVISSLQLIEETLTILGFKHHLCLYGRVRSAKLRQILEERGGMEMHSGEQGSPRLDFMVGDHLGRQWVAFSIELAANGVFVTASVERLVALLLEMRSPTNER